MFAPFRTHVTIDGKRLRAGRGMTILDAARKLGIEIPTLCHVPGHRPAGVCRICVVEVSGSRTLVAACHTPVSEGMQVHTRSPKVRAVRRGLIELMMAAHTGECVTDPNAEHCRLHNLASEHEVGAPRFPIAAPRNDPVERINPFVRRDPSKCILCRRCVTACREIAGKNILDIGYRGFAARVVTGYDDPLTNHACRDCGVCIELCPTGALCNPSGSVSVPSGAPADRTAQKQPPSDANRLQLLPMLKQALAESGRLSREQMAHIAAEINLSLTEVYAVASFYAFLPRDCGAENRIRVCGCVPCETKGASGVISEISAGLGIVPGQTTADGKFSLETTGCIGACDQAPAMQVNDHRHTSLDSRKIADILKNPAASEIPLPARPESHPLEQRVVLRNCGIIDPTDISAYLDRGGFAAFCKARDIMKPEQIIDAVKQSGLTGRGGAGFSCGLKWEIAAGQKSKEKYLVCNADEGEVGTFKDRYILMHDPFGLIEGMCIAGLAVGASRAYIYLRAEYHDLYERLTSAIEQARGRGFLDHMDIMIFEGAGAYICGEETALLNSIEGFRGESRYKPPYPPVQGLHGRPTIINNVETLMNIAPILENGPAWFAAMGTQKSKGTKVFCVSGDVAAPGVYEMRMGTLLRELVVDIAGAEDVMAVQVGGAAGRILPRDMLETPLAHETVLGSGAVVVLNRTRDMIAVVHSNLRFLREESCGKCTPCRDGLEAMTGIYERFENGNCAASDLAALEALCRVMSGSAMCGLGQSAPVPVMDSLAYFREPYVNRIRQSAYFRGYPAKGRTPAPQEV